MHSQNSYKTKQLTRGGQITFHNIRMWFQINQVLFKICKIFWFISTLLVAWVITPKQFYTAAWYWCQAQIYPILKLLDIKVPVFKVLYHNKIYWIHPNRFLHIPELVKNAHTFLYYAAVAAVISLVLTGIFFYLVSKYLVQKGDKQTANQFIRGARLDTPKNVAKQIKKQKIASDITIDGMPIIAGSETKHFLVHGSTGSGKTQLISKLLDNLRRRGDKVFLYDKGGVYTSTFYRPNQDKILNPFDSRCENWNLWHEARTATDFENMAESLIPMHGEAEPFWVNAARTIFGSAAFTMQDEDDRSIKKLLNLLLTSELKDLHSYLANTEAATLASDKIEKTAISIRSVITTYLKSLRFLVGIEQSSKPKFSIRDWLCNEKDDGWLFLSSNAAQHASLKPLISMWFSMATITLLALPENRNRRIWFICDELPSLHKLPQLPESIAEARKYGGCFVLGMQSYAQLEKVYGRNAGREIFDLMNTSFFFRNPSPDMAELVSRALGSQEIEDMRENYSYGANTIRDGISIGSQRMINQIVTPSEIMDLADLRCYLRLAGPYPITLLELILDKRPQIAEGFIPNISESDQEIEELIEQFDSKVRSFHAEKKRVSKTYESIVDKPKIANRPTLANESKTIKPKVTVSSDDESTTIKSKVVKNIDNEDLPNEPFNQESEFPADT